MELVMIITVLSIFFSGLLPHCSASPQLPLMKPPLQYQVNGHQLFLPPFPRKLMSTEQQVKKLEATLDASRKDDKENFPGKEEEREQKTKVVGKKKGTREEWEEGDDPSQYFTMDYSRVRRRRPIHNKNIPVAP
ncbi:probable root meristem growth factor 8 [Neltuma alba]|uniref:probable root meristem growth factor 8 n=1 Tax=Neltuma alba TaxID=207710 RepID=UPI0010A5105F|nr:probable root meristem growth factor 8 [Prosopis alba]